MNATHQQAIDQLNSFLRGELSAVETYRLALDKVKDTTLRAPIQQAEVDHRRRVELLKQRITQLGAAPAEGSGAWGVWAKLVQGSADIVGEKAAVNALESGEDHGLADYRADLTKLDADTRRFVETDLLPAQVRTHGALSNLKKMMN